MSLKNKHDIHVVKMLSNVLIKNNDKFFLIKRAANKKTAPNIIHSFGGHIDHYENPFEAAKREIREEAGVELKNLKLRAVVTEIKNGEPKPPNWIIYHFIADYHFGNIKKTEEGELVKLSETELSDCDMLPSFKQIIKHLLSHNKKIMFVTFIYDNKGGLSEVKNVSYA